MVHPQIRREQLSSQKRDFGARAPTSFVAHLVAGLLAVPHDPWAARLSSTKHVGRPFLGSILGLPAVAETIRACAEDTVAGAPVLAQRLGRAQHHRVVPRSLPVAHTRSKARDVSVGGNAFPLSERRRRSTRRDGDAPLQRTWARWSGGSPRAVSALG